MLKMRVRVGRRLKRLAARAHRPGLKRRSISGSAAIEFAFVAPIFFLFLMATIETGIIYLGNFVLQNAVGDAARQIRTGQAATSNMTQAQFRTLICNGISPLLSCDSNLQIDVETFTNFASASISNPITASGGLDPSLNNWAPGTVCSIVLVRAFYTWTVATPLLTPFLVNMSNSDHLLSAAVVFRNEPYNTSVSGC